MRVSESVEKAFQLDFLKLKRRRKGVGVGVTAALIIMAIGRCWVCGIGSSTALLLSDAMLLLTKERSGLYLRLQRLLLNEQGSFGSCIKLKWCESDNSSTRSTLSSVLLGSPGGAVAVEVANDHIGRTVRLVGGLQREVMVILPMLTVRISMSLFSVIVEVMTRSGFT